MKTFYKVLRTEPTTFTKTDGPAPFTQARTVITDTLETGDEVIKAVDAETWKEARGLLIPPMTPQEKDLSEYFANGKR